LARLFRVTFVGVRTTGRPPGPAGTLTLCFPSEQCQWNKGTTGQMCPFNSFMEKLKRARYTLEYKLEALPSLGFGLLDNRLRVVVPDEASKLEAFLLGLGCGFLPETVA